jgi:hypothetical protein
MVKVRDAELAPSLSVRVALHTLLPKAFTAGVKLSSPAGLSCGAALNSAVLLQPRLKVTGWSVSPGPAEMLLAQVLL